MVHVDILGATQAGHDVGRYEGSELKGKVCLVLTFSCSINGPDDIVVELLDPDRIHLWKALNNVRTDALNVLLLKRIDVLNQRTGGLSRREKRSHRVVDGEVGQSCAKDLVREIDHAQRVVDEQVAAHQLVDEEFFYQGERRIVVEHTFSLAWLRLIDFRRILLKFALVLSELLLALTLVLRLCGNSLREE